MALDIRWFKQISDNTWKCYRLTIGDSPVGSSVHWIDYFIEDWEGDHPTSTEVVYANLVWSFWRHKKFRKALK